jgi:methyl-accepting chemotaxis protein
MCNAISMLNDRSEVGTHRIAGYIDGLKDILSTIERLSEISSTTAAAVEEQGAA